MIIRKLIEATLAIIIFIVIPLYLIITNFAQAKDHIRESLSTHHLM